MNKKQKEVQQVFLDSEKEVLKKLKKNYQDALDEINTKIEILMARQDADMQHVIYQVEYQKALKTQVQGILDTLQANEFETVSEYLAKSYEDGFIGTMYDMQGQGIPLVMPIDQEQVVKAIQHETKLSESLYNSLGKDIKVLNKQIAGEISRGISTGMMFSEISRNIAGYAGISRNKAMRIARTEGHRIQCKATMDACYKAKEKGADVVKQWDASLDGKTRPTHRKLDGQIRELEEEFEVSGYKAMMPGGFNKASEDINCRCALLQRAKWALDEEELATLQERAEYFGLDKTKDFADYKKKYLKATEKVVEPSDIIEFTPAKSIKEAEEYIAQYIDLNIWGGAGISYKGISIESANAVNETLNELYSTYNLNKLGGVYVAKGNTKLGKTIQNATAAYSPVRQSLLLNNNAMKDIDSVIKGKEEELRLISLYKNDPKGLTFKTKRAEDVMKASLVSGRATVPDDIRDVINHEMGHSIERVVSRNANYTVVKERMSEYAEKISGYATINEAEYIAESFASYQKGENLIDPELAKIFDSLKQTSNGVEKVVKSATITTQPLNYFNTKNIKTVYLPKDEYAHVMSEINTHMSDEQRAMPVVSKAIGNYIYTFENYGFNEYRIIGKKLIEGDKYAEIERIFEE